jgi:hypothetical protein
MATNLGGEVDSMANKAKNAANAARQTELVDKLVRIGYLARGIVYGLIGYLAVRTVMNGQGKITDQKGALASIANQPFGKWVLILVAIGLFGLFLWGLIRAIADPMGKGSNFKGLVVRAGYLVSGLSYGALFVPTLNLIQGPGGRSIPTTGQSTQSAAAGIMAQPWGPILIGLIGLVLLGAGAARIWDGYRAKFHERFKAYAMNAVQREWAVRMGRFGYVALGLVFVIIGFLAFLAAVTRNPAKVRGLDGALLFLAQQPYGQFLLAIVALGLIAFAIYSFMGAFWFRIRTH